MDRFVDTASETEQAPEALGLGAKLKRLLGIDASAAAPVSAESLPKGDYRDIDARRTAARARLGRELADFVEFF